MRSKKVKLMLKPCKEEPTEAVLRILARMIARDIIRKQAVIRQSASPQITKEEKTNDV
jgi:hypothetical protein